MFGSEGGNHDASILLLSRLRDTNCDGFFFSHMGGCSSNVVEIRFDEASVNWLGYSLDKPR